MSLPAVAAPPRTIDTLGEEVRREGGFDRSSGQHGEKAQGDRMQRGHGEPEAETDDLPD